MGEEIRLLRSFHKRLINVTREATAVFAHRIEEVERINAAEELTEGTKPLASKVIETMDKWYHTRTDDEISWLRTQNISGTIIKALEDMLDTKDNTNKVTRWTAGWGRASQDVVEVGPFFSRDIEYKIDEDGFIYDKKSGEGIGKYNKGERLVKMYTVGKKLVLAEPLDATEPSEIPEPPDAAEQQEIPEPPDAAEPSEIPEPPVTTESTGTIKSPDATESPYVFLEVTEERIDEFANTYRGSEGAVVFVTEV